MNDNERLPSGLHGLTSKGRSRIMVILTFKFDESYKERSLMVAGWIADGRQWKRLESR